MLQKLNITDFITNLVIISVMLVPWHESLLWHIFGETDKVQKFRL